MGDKMKYSSPQALLNRYFKKSKKFKYIMSDSDEYENQDFLLTNLEGEEFILDEIMPRDWETNSQDLKQLHCGHLTQCVEKMREYYKAGK